MTSTHDGHKSEGNFVNGELSEGKICYSDGIVQEGKWLDRKMHGLGKIIRTDGSVIEAEFDLGQYVDQDNVKITVAGEAKTSE